MPSRRLVTGFALAIAAALLSACGSGDGEAADSQRSTSVVASTTQVADLARAVAGDRATVRQLLTPNSDPHEYEPRPSDVAAVAGADVVLRSGEDLDEWLEDVLRNADSKARTVTLIDAVRTRTTSEGDAEQAEHDGADPHWWQDPRNAVVAVEAIRDALIAADPAGGEVYERNAGALLVELRELDAAIASCMDAIPTAKRKLVTDHDALGYYADRYGIEVVGTVIPALSTRAQASAGEVARLVREIRSAGVTTIFPESSVNAKLTRAIADEAGAKVGPALYADTLGPKGSPGETYLGSLRFNTQALAAGFTGRQRPCRL